MEPAAYPPPAQILSLLLDAIFLDALCYDMRLMERFNRLTEQLPEQDRLGLRPIRLAVIRPTSDISQMAARLEPQLPRVFRFLTRGFGTRESHDASSLSMIMFEPKYIESLLAAGEADAELQRSRIAEFLGCIRSAL